ncbi:MAG TPA: hypothetical protein VHX11_03520 [Acidobacteriaceae bacterium]|jgi:hypothetical protein|nr:hypothetical protein [Acidobacteriaceae bacterium]
MVWDVSFTCDICGRKKGDSNHWWMLALGDVPCFDPGQPNHRFTLIPWNAAESQSTEFYHACGQGCAMQAMERFMTYGSIVPTEGAFQAAGRSSQDESAG